MALWFETRGVAALLTMRVRDARRCRARHHGVWQAIRAARPHPEERAIARVSKDEAAELENALAALADQCPKHPAHLALGFLDPRLERREVRGVAGARHHPQQIFSGGFRFEFFTDTEP